MGEYDHLSAISRDLGDLVNRLPPAESVLAAERIVEHDGLLCEPFILFEVSKEERQCRASSCRPRLRCS